MEMFLTFKVGQKDFQTVAGTGIEKSDAAQVVQISSRCSSWRSFGSILFKAY
jgi:hypothetical protein